MRFSRKLKFFLRNGNNVRDYIVLNILTDEHLVTSLLVLVVVNDHFAWTKIKTAGDSLYLVTTIDILSFE